MSTVSLYQVSKVLGATRVSAMAPLVGLHWPPPPPISLDTLVNSPELLRTQPYSFEWTTPPGTPLGGRVTLTLNSDGTYSVDFETWCSSVLTSFDFQLRAYLSGPGLPTLFFYHAGSVAGQVGGSGTDSHQESGSNPLIQMYWSQIVSSASFSVAKDYKWSGPIGTIVNLVDDLLDIGAVAAGEAVGAIIALTREAIGFLGATLGPGGTIGVIAGFVVFALGAVAGLPLGSALILGTVAGVASGAVANALIDSRPMAPAEIAVAQEVFGSQLPYENVMFTNLCGLGGRAFTAPGVDGKTYCNLGGSYNDTSAGYPTAYPAPSELMIHELTHAWQIAHNSFLPGFVCSGVVNQANYVMGDDIYAYGAPGPPWASFNLEQQGQIVNQWFGGDGNSQLWGPQNKGNPYYEYVSGNILTGTAGYSTSWLGS